MTQASALTEELATITDPRRRLEIIEDRFSPPEPQLLDTCVLQHLDWIDRSSETWLENYSEEGEHRLQRRFGMEMAEDLVDLGTLYRRFEDDGGYPWLVCSAAVEEAHVLSGPRGKSLGQLLQFLIDHQRDWVSDAFPGIAQGLLLADRRARVSPLILRGLGVASVEEVVDPGGPLKFLPDRGDRLVVSHALLANIPAILTTDRRTLWVHRERLQAFGVQVLRPSELLDMYVPYWDALSEEWKRRAGPDGHASKDP